MRWLWQVSKDNRLQALLNALIGLAGVVVSLLSVWWVQHAIDIAAGNISGSLYMAVGVMALLVVIDFGLNIAKVWIKNILGVKAQNRMQQRLLAHLLQAEWNSKERHHSGDIINRLEQDVQKVVEFITEILPNTLSVLVLFVGAFIYLYRMDHMLAIITVTMLPVFILFSKLYMRYGKKYTRLVRNSDSKVQSILQETVQHRMVVKTLECMPLMLQRLETTHHQLRHNVKRQTTFRVISNLSMNIGFAASYLIAFLWSTTRLYHHTLTFGGMTAFLQLVNRIQTPARDLTRLVPAFVAAMTAVERLRELQQLPAEEKGTPCLMDTPCGIRLDNVCYRYEDSEEDVVKNLSFNFAPGTCTAILGETGAGKTTLLRLILALQKPQQGSITFYDGKHEEQASALTRCNIVYVPQGNTLMSGSIRDNLLMANEQADEEELKEALHTACADFVMQLPQQMDTLITEGGGGLSEGQAQRIAIARGLLRKRGVLLMDEATSALDKETEQQLLHNLLSSHHHTVICVTHRLAVTKYCDRILEVKNI